MNNSMKSTGKTVDEAVREALLRMGLRREEVNVKVIQEARGGFLGMGKREAVVEVEKKSGSRDSRGGRSPRSGRDDRGERGERDESRGRGRGGRRRGGEGGDADGEDRGKKREGSRRGSRGGRGRRRGGEDREAGQQQEAAEAKKEAQASRPAERDAGGGDQQDQEQKSGRSRRRGRRSRGGRRRGGARADEAANGSQQEATGDGRRQEAQTDDRRNDRDAGAKRGRGSESDRGAEPGHERPAAQAGSGEPKADPAGSAPRPEAASTSPVAEEKPVAGAETTGAEAKDDTAAGPDTVVVDVPAAERAPRIAADEQVDEPELLRRTATTLMVKSGFQSRVQVTPGEYHKVKMVVDDRSAGVLIGRQGSTVDAVEHLVERIATHAVGDRVKMNLDINNYRLRREDGLLGQTRRAIQEARATGEPVAMDPAGGRERRIVHLEVADDEELVTYTDESEDGKRVVICRRDQVPARYRDPELHGPAPAGDGDGHQDADRAEGGEAAAAPQAAEANRESPVDAEAPETTGVAGASQSETESPTDDERERDDR
jgi:spoIIIJ-associated protein